MIVKFDGSVVNFRERLQELEKKRGPSAEKKEKSSESSSTKTGQIADVISIRNENRLAALGNVKTEADAGKLLDDLRQSFAGDSSRAMDAHKKADPNKVLRFYPFE